jgi:hypothetical protein
MSETPDTTYLFAGSGASTKANTEELLDSHLPADVTDVVLQTKIDSDNKGLKTVEAFLLKEFTDGITRCDDMLDHIASLDIQKGEEVYLVLLWNDDDESRELVVAANAAGIVTKDLTDGLDVILWEEDKPPEPEETPEPPARPKRRSRAARAADNADREAASVPAPRRGKDTQETVEAVTEALSPVTTVPSATLTLTAEELNTLIDVRISMAFYDLASTLTRPGKAQEVYKEQTGPSPYSERDEAEALDPTDAGVPAAPPTPAVTHGRARRTGAEETEEKFTFIMNDEGDQVLRKRGRGKPRSNQVVAELTLAEAREKGYDG